MRLLLPLLVLAAGGFSQPAGAKDVCAAKSTRTTVPLVELYTSEGCSSCPPADRWLSATADGGDGNFLAFHVDYWDTIGWPDRFGSADYSRRQRNRVAAANGGSTVYTPQVMVGSSVRTNWRDDGAWKQTLEQARATESPVGLALSLRRRGTGWSASLGAAAQDASSKDAQVWLARYVDGQTTRVEAGENRGVTLHHDRVVRQLAGPWTLGELPLSRQVDLPVDGDGSAWGVTAFVQDVRGRTLQSLDLDADACVTQRSAAGGDA